MHVTIKLSVEAAEALAELSEIFGTPMATIVNRVVNSSLETLAFLAETSEEAQTLKKRGNNAMTYFYQHRDNPDFYKCVRQLADESQLSGTEIVERCKAKLALPSIEAEPESRTQLPQPLLEPEQDFAQLDEEIRYRERRG